MKKLLSMVMAAALCVCMVSPAFAADTSKQTKEQASENSLFDFDTSFDLTNHQEQKQKIVLPNGHDVTVVIKPENALMHPDDLNYTIGDIYDDNWQVGFWENGEGILYTVAIRSGKIVNAYDLEASLDNATVDSQSLKYNSTSARAIVRFKVKQIVTVAKKSTKITSYTYETFYVDSNLSGKNLKVHGYAK